MSATEQKQEIRVCMRWIVRRDMPEICAVENIYFEFPWLEEDFLRCLKENCKGMVADYEDKVVGFMIFELHETRIHVLDFAVHPSYIRQGVGSQMVAKLISKLSAQGRNRIILYVRETNLEAQLFFSECEFNAVSILHGFYEDSPEDAYLMEYICKCKPEAKTEAEFQQFPHMPRLPG